GEGTFGVKGLSPYFQVAQHDRSLMVLQAISAYIAQLTQLPTFSLNTGTPNPIFALNNLTNVWTLSLSDVDVIHDYFVYFLASMPFQTRKGVDFYYWSIVVYAHKFGFFYLAEGRALVVAIAAYSKARGALQQQPKRKFCGNA
ncbi:hypothetical protein HK100_001972, partial [Physocladia obscura]